VRLALATVLCPILLFAQSPPRRAHHALVYDEARERVLLTGGSTPLDSGQHFQFFNDLWAFDGTSWTRLPESGQKLSGMRLAWDAPRSRVVSFGGYLGRSFGLLRTLRDDQWVTLGDYPDLAAAEPGFVFDRMRSRLVVFGGSTGPGQALGRTMEFDGTTWIAREVTGPSQRQAHAMVYDEQRGRVVVFGGLGTAPGGQQPPLIGELWEFDGEKWTERTEPGGPGPRHSPGVAYDTRRGLTILFGGLTATGFAGDTWSWDGTAWKQLAQTGPAPRAMGYMAYDRKHDRIVLFGGRKGWPDGDLNDTWEWNGTEWRRVGPE
jgi:hypothetical protein